MGAHVHVVFRSEKIEITVTTDTRPDELGPGWKKEGDMVDDSWRMGNGVDGR